MSPESGAPTGVVNGLGCESMISVVSRGAKVVWIGVVNDFKGCVWGFWWVSWGRVGIGLVFSGGYCGLTAGKSAGRKKSTRSGVVNAEPGSAGIGGFPSSSPAGVSWNGDLMLGAAGEVGHCCVAEMG